MSSEETPKPLGDWPAFCPTDGLSAREITAIELRIPQSGREWIDDMIRKANRDELAAKAMQAIVAKTPLQADWLDDPETTAHRKQTMECVSRGAYLYSDAMLAAREVKQ